MTTYLSPMESLEMFGLPEKNDQTLPQFTLPDEYFFDGTLPTEYPFHDVSQFQQQQGLADFHFATSLDPSLQDANSKNMPPSYPGYDPSLHSRPISPSSSRCSDELANHSIPFQELWSPTMFTGDPAYLDTQSAFIARPVPLSTSSYDSYQSSNPSVGKSSRAFQASQVVHAEMVMLIIALQTPLSSSKFPHRSLPLTRLSTHHSRAYLNLHHSPPRGPMTRPSCGRLLSPQTMSHRQCIDHPNTDLLAIHPYTP